MQDVESDRSLPSFFRKLGGGQLLLFSNRLWSFSQEMSGSYLSVYNTALYLTESEHPSDTNRRFLLADRLHLEELLQRIVCAHAEMNHVKERLDTAKKTYDIEVFLQKTLDEVCSRGNKAPHQQASEKLNLPSGKEISLDVETVVDTLVNNFNFFDKLNLFIYRGKLFRTTKKVSDPDFFLVFHGKQFGLEYAGPAAQYDQYYERHLVSQLERVVSKMARNILRSKQKLDVGSILDARGCSFPREDKEKGLSVWFQKHDTGTYLVYMNMKPFIFKKGNEHYFLNSKMLLSTTVRFKNSNIVISDPMEPVEYFRHPFMRKSGTFCWGGRNWKNHGIYFGAYAMNQLEEAARTLKNIIYEAERIVHRYKTLRLMEFNDLPLTSSNFPDEYIDVGKAKRLNREGVKIIEDA